MDNVESWRLREVLLVAQMACGTYVGQHCYYDLSVCHMPTFDIEPQLPSFGHLDMVRRMHVKLGPIDHPYLMQRWESQPIPPPRVFPSELIAALSQPVVLSPSEKLLAACDDSETDDAPAVKKRRSQRCAKFATAIRKNNRRGCDRKPSVANSRTRRRTRL